MISRPLLFLSFALPAVAQIPAFPGAEGYGAYATGGRGGDVYHVTNLNASGSGSFFDAIASVPAAGRTIVFDVSGYIRLPNGSNGTRMTASKVTIAGQTAPGGGIGFYNNFFRISGDDVILRHLRFRRGKTDSSGDCVDLDSGCRNSVLDHISIAFSTDENISSFGSPPENLTFQWSLNSWGLNNHSAGGLWDQNHATCHHTLWAHNHTRNPKARPGGLLEWTNNVIFDWDIGFIMGDSQTPASWKSNVRGNYFVSPPGNIRNTPLEKAGLDRNGHPNFSVYLDNNLHDRDGDGILNGTDRGYSIVGGSAYDAATNPTGNYIKLLSPAAGSALLDIDPPLLAYKKIVSDAGALRMDAAYASPLRDEVDTRMMQNLVSQTPNHISNPNQLAGISNGGLGTLNSETAPLDTDRDGMPDAYENALGWDPAIQDHNTTVAGAGYFAVGTPAGYTRLEEYLHFKSAPHMVLPKSAATAADIDLKRFTSGFSNSPVFTIANAAGGVVSQAGTGGSLISFTAAASAGRGGFDFTVTDADGSTWTRRFLICVTNNSAPADLTWRGGGSDWNTTSLNWLKGGVPATFGNNDRASFTDAGAAAPTVNMPAPVYAGSIEIDAAANYTFTGVDSISSAAPLTKRGDGTLTIANTAANSFGGVLLEQGKLTINTAGGVGASTISCLGGTLALGPASNSTIPAPLEFLAPTTIIPTSQHTAAGNWSGTKQTVHLSGGSNLWTIAGTWTGFSGKLDFGNGSTRVRLNGNANTNFGSAAVAVDLGSNNAQLMNRNGATITLGSLESTGAGTVLSGTQTGSAASTYNIGALGTDVTFAGVIADGGGITNIVKSGGGRWTLTGASTYTGTTSLSAGSLYVNGTTASSAITTESGTTLGGDNTIGGTVTARSGSIISPGAAPDQTGTLTIAGGLAINGGASLDFQLGATPGGANDKIVVAGGDLALASPVNITILRTAGTLGNGAYPLISGNARQTGSGITINLTGIPASTRQTFGIQRQANGGTPAYINLAVGGTPAAALLWNGTNAGGLWDLNTTGNFTNGPTPTFYNLDAVTFDDSSAVGTVVLSGVLKPRAVNIANDSLAYTFSGSGEIGGSAALMKTGAGTLTLASANSFSGGTTISAGSTIQLGNDAANAGALGSGPVTLLGGTLNMFRNGASYNSAYYQLVVPEGEHGTFNADDRTDLYGTLAGGGILHFRIPWIRTDLHADWSAFTGRIDATASTGYGEFRIAANYAPTGFPNAEVHLGAGVVMKHTGLLNQGEGTTISIGALSGDAGSTLLGGITGGRALTYRIGGKGIDCTFSGAIAEQSPGNTLTNIVKTGAGVWTLNGEGSWSGGTWIEQGTLSISGNFSSSGAVAIAGGAGLTLTGGTLATDSVNVDVTASLNGYGNVDGDLMSSGTIALHGFSPGTPATLAIDGNVSLGPQSKLRMGVGIGHDELTVTGDLALDGVMEIDLSSGIGFGRFSLIICSGDLSGTLALAGLPDGVPAHLSQSVAGRVDLVIGDNDEDGLPDVWETNHFGNLESGAADDNDADGTNNLAEYRLGLDPADAASAFRATIAGTGNLTWPAAADVVFTIERSLDLQDGNWESVGTVTEPHGSTAAWSDEESFPRAFYRVSFQP